MQSCTCIAKYTTFRPLGIYKDVTDSYELMVFAYICSYIDMYYIQILAVQTFQPLGV